MHIIDRIEIEKWGETLESKGLIPLLISRLVRATTDKNIFVEFPFGSATSIGGWDGIVDSRSQYGYVPEGRSLWEIGTEKNAKRKAEADYQKRTKDSLGNDIHECTFIFITTRFFREKAKWCQDKREEGKWKNIIAYDSRNIVEWLDNAPGVSNWFIEEIKGIRAAGLLVPQFFWKEWSEGEIGVLPPSVITSGREKQSGQLLEFLQAPPAIKALRASSREEALAFVIASAENFDHEEREYFFSRTIISTSIESFRMINLSKIPLLLIVMFEEKDIVYSGVSNGHHVLMPLGGDEQIFGTEISLPSISRDGLIDALITMGLSETDASRYARESGRNVTILKRILKFPSKNLNWATSDNARDVIPAMLLGRWDESYSGDRELLGSLAGEEYDSYIKKVSKWRSADVFPFIQIGDLWRLTSPMDTCSVLLKFLLKADFEILSRVFDIVFTYESKIGQSDTPNDLSLFNSFSRPYYSKWSREGLIQSLVLINLYGKGLSITSDISPAEWVDEVIYKLLGNASSKQWISLNSELPLLAEASPASFIKSVFNSLSDENRPILEMFKESNSLYIPSGNYTGLLFALEGLAWIPQHFYEATFLLGKLASLDPGGRLSNRPINSLKEIFKPWRFQTLATFSDRMTVLGKILEKEAEVGWELLMDMLPAKHQNAKSTHRLRWSAFNENFDIVYTYKELFETHEYVVDLLIETFDNSEKRLRDLIIASVRLREGDFLKLLEFVDSVIPRVSVDSLTTWHALRRILSHHRSFPDAPWAMKEERLARYGQLYLKLMPLDTVSQFLWLFEDSRPDFIEGNSRNIEEYGETLDSKRTEAVQIWLNVLGLEGIIDLVSSIKLPWALGYHVSRLTTDDQVIPVCKFLVYGGKIIDFIHGFINAKTSANGPEWFYCLYDRLESSNSFDAKSLSRLLMAIPAPSSIDLWRRIDSFNDEVRSEYWHAVPLSLFYLTSEERLRGVTEMIKFRRYSSGVKLTSGIANEIASEMIVGILTKIMTNDSIEAIEYEELDIISLFDELNKRSDVNDDERISLEWLFIPFFNNSDYYDRTLGLHKHLAQSPEFFVDVVRALYKSDKNTELEEEGTLVDVWAFQMAKNAYILLDSWNIIPGMQEDGTVEIEYLKSYVNLSRDLAIKYGRTGSIDRYLAKILAQYPGITRTGLPMGICKAIEDIGTKELLDNLQIEIYNRRGVVVREGREGGRLETVESDHFFRLANLYKIDFPNVSQVFASLAKSYLKEAKRNDLTAEIEDLEF